MLRRSLLLTLVAGLVGVIRPAMAQPKGKGKSKKKDDAKILKPGDQVRVHIIGDEAKEKPNLTQAGTVNVTSLVLPVLRLITQDASRGSDRRHDDETMDLFEASAKIGDKLGIEKLMAEGRAVRIPEGTTLIVLSRRPTLVNSYTQLPVVPAGDCRARVVDGDAKGKIIEIPVRNLR